MIPAKLDDATVEHVNRLIAAGVAESKTLEFKRDVPGRDNSAKHEFLADVCALANAAGGDIIFGLDENNDGVATNIVGQAVNPDNECLRLQDVVLNGLEPKLTGVHAHAVQVEEGKHVFILRVPQSWVPPHRVKTNQHFFIREGRRKRQLDMPEVRIAVIQSENLRERVRSFRADRIGKLIAGEGPVPLLEGAIQVLHVLPVSSILAGKAVDVTDYHNNRSIPVISRGTGGFRKINLDGVLNHHNRPDQPCDAYTQIFRDGTLEAVRVFYYKHNGRFPMSGLDSEHDLVNFFECVKPELNRLESMPPIMLMYFLIKATDVEFYKRGSFGSIDSALFDRSILALPEAVIEDLVLPAHQLLKPIFDLVWNAAGFTGSPNYDANGEWKPRQ